MSVLAVILKRPIILLKKERSLIGYVASAIYPPADEDKGMAPAIIFHEECYFRNILFCSPEVKASFSQRVMDFYYRESFDDDHDVENLCDTEEDSESVHSEEEIKILHQVQKTHITLQYIGLSACLHNLASKITFWDQVVHISRQLTVQHGDMLKLKSRHQFAARFYFVGALEAVLKRKKMPKLVLLVFDKVQGQLFSCNISDIVGLTGRGEMTDIDRLLKKLGLSISKQKELSMIQKYDVVTQSSIKMESKSAYSPLVDIPNNSGNSGKSKAANKTNAKKNTRNVTKKKASVSADSINKVDENFSVSAVATHLLQYSFAIRSCIVLSSLFMLLSSGI